MSFEAINPIIHNMTVTGTTIGAEVRTVSASGINDSQIPYVDQGFESITIGNLSNSWVYFRWIQFTRTL